MCICANACAKKIHLLWRNTGRKKIYSLIQDIRVRNQYTKISFGVKNRFKSLFFQIKFIKKFANTLILI